VSNKDPMVRQPPTAPDPYDMEAKRKMHPLADQKNFIYKGNLRCGGKKVNSEDVCKQYAGAGTGHKGYGRCKFCGGVSTGPKTPEGMAAASQNARKHGLYSSALTEEEAVIFDELVETTNARDLESEIFTLKAKIIHYLRANKGKEERRRTAVEGAINAYEYYTVGTIEDKPFIRALSELGRLVEKHARLTVESGEDLLSSINKELQQASQGRIEVSWGGKPQMRAEQPDV